MYTKGRSRNDQVATDVRLYLREEVKRIQGLLSELLLTMGALAEEHVDLLMAGFTHLQVGRYIGSDRIRKMMMIDEALTTLSMDMHSPLNQSVSAIGSYPTLRPYFVIVNV